MNKGIMLNIDDTHFYYSRKRLDLHPDEAALRAFVRQYQGTQVTDLLLCVAGRIADFPSRVTDSCLDKYSQTRENGRDVDYRDSLYAVPHELYEKGLDPFAVWLDEARRCGIRPWLSVRMNDCHECLSPTSFLHPNFFHEHPECRRVRHRDDSGYYDRCYDYERPEVRARMLALIEEILERYAPDGLELDWLREVYCFQPGHENPALMTAFMREVRALVRRTEERSGHAIPICARVPADPSDAFDMGFDVAAWADEGLIQTVCPAPRWATLDTDMPVALWKRLLRGTDVQLAPGMELLIRPSRGARPLFTNENHVTAAAAQFFSLGADKIYLYNYFDDPDRTYWRPAEGQTALAVSAQGQRRLLNLIGDPEKVMASERCHMITYRDLQPAWRNLADPLPVSLPGDGAIRCLRVVTGAVPAGMKALLRLGVRMDEGASLSVWVNSRDVRPAETQVCAPAYTARPLMTYELSGGLPEGAALIELSAAGGTADIDYADILLIPQE